MVVIAILVAFAAVAVLCWLLFLFAIYALPLFVGMTVGAWAFHTGAGLLGAFVTGITCAGVTLAAGQLLLIVVRPIWARLSIAAVFVAPAVIADYHATHGIVKHIMPSDVWQIAFSLLGGCFVGVAAFTRMVAIPTFMPDD